MNLDKRKLQKLALKKPELVSALLSIEETQVLLDTVNEQDKAFKELLSLHKEVTGTLLEDNKSIQLDAIGVRKAEVTNGELLLHFDNKTINLGKVVGKDGLDAVNPTKKELLSLIKPLIPKVKPAVDGRTPIKGKDYFTKTDKDEFVNIIKDDVTELLLESNEFDINIEDIADELENLEGDKRLSFNSLKDTPDFSNLLANISSQTASRGGSGQTQFYNDNKILGFTESINFGSGINAVLSGGIMNVTAMGGGGGGQVDSIVGGTDISIDNTDPVNPIISFDNTSGYITDVAWGSITGILSNQADLQAELDLKADVTDLNNVAYTNVNNIFTEDQIIQGTLAVGTDTAEGVAHIQDAEVTNKVIDQDATLIVEGSEGLIQVVAADTGGYAGGMIMTAVPTSGNNKFWGVLNMGPGLNNRLRIGYYSGSGRPLTGISQYIDVLNTGNVGIGGTPTDKLHVFGDARITGAIKDSSNSSGSSTQVLTSTGSGTQWNDLSVYNTQLLGVYNQLGGQGSKDVGMNGLYDRTVSTNADFRGSVTINTITGSATIPSDVSPLTNAQGDFFNITNASSDLELDIIIDNGENADNYSSANWQPFFQKRLGANSYGRFRSISAFVSTDNITWYQPASGWSIDNYNDDTNSVPITYWFGSNAVPGVPTATWRYAKFELRDFTEGSSGSLGTRVAISQIGIRHLSEQYARQYLRERDVLSNGLTANTLSSNGFTVSTLPTGITGMMAHVTDASTGGSGTTVTGGGSETVPVFYNGSNWIRIY